MNNLIIGVNGVDVIKYCNVPLCFDAGVVVGTLEIERSYAGAPWLCTDAVIYQRLYELKNAFSVFEVSKILLLDYPTSEDIELERLLAQLQMQVLLLSVGTLYYTGENVIIRTCCENLCGVKEKIQFLNQESSLSTHFRKEKALTKIYELL